MARGGPSAPRVSRWRASPPSSASRDTVFRLRMSPRWSVYAAGIGRRCGWGCPPHPWPPRKRAVSECVSHACVPESRPRYSPVMEAPSPLGQRGPQRGQEPLESPVCTAGGRDLNRGACHSAPAPLALAAAVRVPSCLPSARTPEPFPNTTNSGRVACPPLLDACPPLGGRCWAARSAGTSRGLADSPGSQGRWDPPVSHAGLAAGSLAARGVVPSGTLPGRPPSLCASLGLGRGWRGGNTGVLGPWRSRGVPPPRRTIASGVLGGPSWEKAAPPRPTLG